MKQKSTAILIAILVVSLAVSLGYVLMNPTTSREPTAQERENAALYIRDWSAWGEGMTEKEFILSLCSPAGEEQIGDNVHTVYSSVVLPEYLYRCRELAEITELEGLLYVSYYGEGEEMVILCYNDVGLYEMSIYDADTDTLYHELDGEAVVWNKFRGGFQWGSN